MPLQVAPLPVPRHCTPIFSRTNTDGSPVTYKLQLCRRIPVIRVLEDGSLRPAPLHILETLRISGPPPTPGELWDATQVLLIQWVPRGP